MKVKWIDFAKRRNLDLDIFRSNMKYEKYVRWCEQRSVIPVDKSDYAIVVQTEEVPEEETISYSIPTAKELGRMTKKKLLEFCNENQIQYEASKTKRELISYLKSLNSDE